MAGLIANVLVAGCVGLVAYGDQWARSYFYASGGKAGSQVLQPR